jgi:hypothetical protein
VAQSPKSPSPRPRKPRQNFVYASAELSRPYPVIVTSQICILWLFPAGSFLLPLCGMVARRADVFQTRSSQLRTNVKGNFDEGCLPPVRVLVMLHDLSLY